MTAIKDALGYIDQTIYANVDNGPGVTWRNGEVLSLLNELRGLLPAPPTDDEREALARILDNSDPEMGGVVADEGHESWEWYLPQVDAVLAAGFRRQGPITDKQVRAALSAWFRRMIAGGWDNTHEVRMRAALEAAATTAQASIVDQWEYGVTTMWGVQLRSSKAHAQEYAATVRRLIEERMTSGDLRFHGNLMRRRPAVEPGPWEPVEAARDAS